MQKCLRKKKKTINKVITECFNILSHIPNIGKFKCVVFLTQYPILKGCLIHPKRQCHNPFHSNSHSAIQT